MMSRRPVPGRQQKYETYPFLPWWKEGRKEGRKAEGVGVGVLVIPILRQALKGTGRVLQIHQGQTWRPLRTSGLEAHVPGTAICRILGPGRACSDSGFEGRWSAG